MDQRHQTDIPYLLALVAFVIALSFPFLRDLHNLPVTEDYDGLQHLSFAYSFYDAIWNHGELPLWNPYFGGGIRWAGYLYNPGISPWGLIYALSGEVVGVKLCLILSLLLGGLATYGVARKFVLLPPPFALFAALLYLSATWMAGRLESGNYNEFSTYFWVVALFCFHELVRGKWLGLLFPLFFIVALNPAKYTALTTFVAGIIILMFSSIYRGQRLFVLSVWLIGTAFGLLLAMPKLLPLWELASLNIASLSTQAPIGYQGLGEIVSRLTSVRLNSHQSYGVGPLGLSLAIIGILLGWKDAREWVVLLTLSVVFAMGPHTPYPLPNIVSNTPLLSSLSDFGKYANVFILTSVCMLAAVGLHRICLLVMRRIKDHTYVRVCFLGFAAIAVILPLWSTFHYFDQAFAVKQPKYSREAFYQVAYTPHIRNIDRYREPPGFLYTDQYRNIRKGIGTITWYGNFAFEENAVPRIFVELDGNPRENPQYIGESALIGEFAPTGHIGPLRISYNKLRVKYTSTTEQRILFNFNFDPGWGSNIGRIVNYRGLLALDVDPANEQVVVLSFRDKSFETSCWIALFALLGYIAFFLKVRNRALFDQTRKTMI